VILVALDESSVSSNPAGLIVPHTAEMSKALYGQVVAIGPDAAGIQFGDVFMLNRWNGRAWWRWPLRTLYGFAEHAEFAPDDGGPERIVLDRDGQMCAMEQSMLVARWATRDWIFHGRGEPPRPRPVADRLMIEHRPDRRRTAGGIELPDGTRDQVGRVVAAGPLVSEVLIGDWVLPMRDRGTEGRHKGVRHTFIRERDIVARSDEEPGEAWTS
jgi:co-chaperonin GroES (HSP10)